MGPLCWNGHIIFLHSLSLPLPPSFPPPAATLFVGNLSFNIGDEELLEFFSSEGHEPSSARVITQQGGRSKG